MGEAQKILNGKDFSVWESHLPQELGVPRDRLQALRTEKLREGTDWIKNGRRILLTQEAADVIRAAVGLPVTNGHEKKQEPCIARKEWTFTVWRVDIPNPKLLLATDGQNIFRVRVKTKDNFVRGMELRCHHEQGDVFTLAGNCPRFRGKY